MRLIWRALPALLLAGAGLLPITHASAGWACTYYDWNAPASRWERVALLQDEDIYEKQPGHARYESWRCKYCTVPAVPPRPDDGSSVYDAIQPLTEQMDQQLAAIATTVHPLTAPVTDLIGATLVAVNPFNGPACPPVPPEWDSV